ncbi:DHHC palmitoyltransferase-domain-containing protein [Lactifluus volemus]|nr:DHHC palmitoyltransferase-domain-containing protein [Lactifluus volemus]
MAYAWISRLRHDAFHKPFIHAAFILLFVLCMVALLCTMFCDPGICTTPRSALKSITEELVQHKRLGTEEFCVDCLVAKPPNTRHCHTCNKCVTRTRSRYMDIHASWMLTCIGTNNHLYFIIFMTSLTSGILIFDYLWIRKHCQRPLVALIYLILWILCLDVLALKDVPFPTRSCVLPVATCRPMSEDTFLCSVAIWSTLQLVRSATRRKYYCLYLI